MSARDAAEIIGEAKADALAHAKRAADAAELAAKAADAPPAEGPVATEIEWGMDSMYKPILDELQKDLQDEDMESSEYEGFSIRYVEAARKTF